MIKLLIGLVLSLNIALAEGRFGVEDKSIFLKEVKQEIAEGKTQNGGVITFEMIRPEFFNELEKYILQKKLLRSEVSAIKNNFNFLSKSNIPAGKVEAEFLKFLDIELSKFTTKLPLVAENGICNELQCDKNLTCAPEPKGSAVNGKKVAGTKCEQDNECSSNECLDDGTGKKTKMCEDVYRCYRPLNLGESCLSNPICGAGSCATYNSQTSGIGECSALSLSCAKNQDCCSGSCVNNKCSENKICKSCAPIGTKPKKLEACCEGLYLNPNGVCTPDFPPSVIIQVKNNTLILIEKTLDLFIGSAKAEDVKEASKSYEQSLVKEIKSDSKLKDNPYKDHGEANDFGDNLVKNKYSFKKGTNFETCEVDFKYDYLNGLTKSGTIDLEMALLAFSFANNFEVDQGKVIKDYWRTSGSAESTSINARAIEISKKLKDKRLEQHAIFVEKSKQMKCKCLDVSGYLNIKDEANKEFFEKSCPEEMKKYANAQKSPDGKKYLDEELNGDASGIKGKTLIDDWLLKLRDTYRDLAVSTFNSSKDFKKLNDWVTNKKWDETRYKNTDLFKFHIQSSSVSMIGMGALAGAILAAGVIGIISGFNPAAFFTVWVLLGIGGASIAGGVGVWTAASLKGAWSSLRPTINDYEVSPRSVSCGKKSTCQEYTRTLQQPYNDICSSHISSNACVKKFMIFVDENQKMRYIVDPIIPFDTNAEQMGYLYSGDLAKDLNAGYDRALKEMKRLDPKTYAGGKSGGQYVEESYLNSIFIDMKITGLYSPGSSNQKALIPITESFVEQFKEAAKKFAISQNMIRESDEENLEVFAQTAYYYHFIWPKLTKLDEISYPTVGMIAYYNLMTNDISTNLSASLVNEANAIDALYNKHAQDLEETKKVYSKGPSVIGINTGSAANNQSAVSDYLSGKGKLTDIKMAELDKSTSAFLNTMQGLRDLRTEQLKNLGMYSDQMKKMGQEDRMNKIASASDAFKSDFASGNNARAKNNGNGTKDKNKARIIPSDNLKNAKTNFFENNKNNSSSALLSKKNPNAKGMGASSSSLGATASGLSGSSSDAKTNGASSNDASKNGNSSGLNNYNNYGMGLDSGSSSQGRGNYGSNSNGTNGSSENGSSNVLGSNGSSKDQTDLEDAINARNRAGKSKYASNDDQSLFEIITNAYIRNYDKVLIKRKDKDTIEDH